MSIKEAIANREAADRALAAALDVRAAWRSGVAAPRPSLLDAFEAAAKAEADFEAALVRLAA